ncbi:MAG: hypothetical protein AAF995_09355 [Planctomycetota bacterium]
MRATVVLLIGLAIVMLTAGAVAFSLAPEGSNALTALIVPGACAVVLVICAALSAMLPKSRKLGMIGIHAGLVFTLLFAAGIGHRAFAAWQGVGQYGANVEAYEASEAGGDAPGPAGSELAFSEWANSEAAPNPGADHDKTYLAVTLTILGAASLITFALLLAKRPKPAGRDGGPDGSGGGSGGESAGGAAASAA